MNQAVPDPVYDDSTSDYEMGYQAGLWVARQGWTPCAMHPSYPVDYVRGYQEGYEQGRGENAA